ncbi:MAG: lytic transglycosylase domain-containing protein [Rhodobacteraceae bacterium]|nr:lytic transglycosylase domain-containing protein [Paracoccaceae bacterium]
MHIYLVARNAAILVLLAFLALPLPAVAHPGEHQAFETALDHAAAGRWTQAYAAAREVGDPAATVVVDWLRLRAGVDSHAPYAQFLQKHSDWPGLKILRRAGEPTLADARPAEIVEYFQVQPPQTGHGALALASALKALGKPNQARRTIIDAWQSLPFDNEATREALKLYGDLLRPHHVNRLDVMLWNDWLSPAGNFLSHVGPAQRALAETRIALRQNRNGVDAKISSLPKAQLADPGLNHDRVLWRLSRGMDHQAAGLVNAFSESPAKLGRPEHWAKTRLRLGYGLMLSGDYRLAYQVASSHHLKSSGSLDSFNWLSDADVESRQRKLRRDYLDLEWLAGFLALRKLNRTELAVAHFQNFMDEVVSPSYEHAGHSPVTRGRAGYWLGRALAASGKSERARAAYAFGAKYQISFYGQLSAERIGAKVDPRLVGGQPWAGKSNGELEEELVVRAALLYSSIGQHPHSAWFLAHRAETLDRMGIMQLAEMARRHGLEFEAVKIAKQGATQGDVVVDYLFPLTSIASQDFAIPTALVISVARQETEFRDTARSTQGAVGLLQLLPSTAQPIVRKLGLSGSTRQILMDPTNNARIGALYLLENVDEFGGSIPLAVAAYNAGPGRVKGWLNTIGDPRIDEKDIIDWIELIPFSETRNYTMRVLESTVVYRMRLSGRTQQINLSRMLESGS